MKCKACNRAIANGKRYVKITGPKQGAILLHMNCAKTAGALDSQGNPVSSFQWSGPTKAKKAKANQPRGQARHKFHIDTEWNKLYAKDKKKLLKEAGYKPDGPLNQKKWKDLSKLAKEKLTYAWGKLGYDMIGATNNPKGKGKGKKKSTPKSPKPKKGKGKKEVCECGWKEQQIRAGICKTCGKPHWAYAKYELGLDVPARTNPSGSYYCPKCKITHRPSSKIGKAHKKQKGSQKKPKANKAKANSGPEWNKAGKVIEAIKAKLKERKSKPLQKSCLLKLKAAATKIIESKVQPRSKAMAILDGLEECLEKNKITVSAPRGERKGSADEARLFGTPYYELEDEITNLLRTS